MASRGAAPARAARAGVVLAAGASERMGSPKALLPWGDTSLLGHALDQARRAEIADIVVVLGPASRHLADSLANVRVVVNPEPETGRSTSIRLGCQALPDGPAGVLIQSVDQPVPAQLLNALFGALSDAADIVLPSVNGRRGHPILVAGRLLPELRAVSEEGQGLRSVVRGHADRLIEVPVSDESVLWNLNDPAAYAAALQAFLSAGNPVQP